MRSVEVKVRRQLNQSQVDVLLWLYKFRFGTRDLLATSLNKQNGTAIYSKLRILLEQGYIASHYNNSYRLRGQPASYYLLPSGLRVLRERAKREDIDEKVLKSSYKDKTASGQFITHNLTIYALCCQLGKLYPAAKLFTKRELSIYDYFPKPLPDTYISWKIKDSTRRFFLELFENTTPAFVIDRRLRQLIEYHQNQQWQAKGNPFPPILCVCETGGLERRVQKQINRALFRSGDEGMLFYTTTQAALLNSGKGSDEVWSGTAEPETLYSLTALPVNA